MRKRRPDVTHLTPTQKLELNASAYIGTLWGKQRREFARRYWRYLIRGMPGDEPPTMAPTFGGRRIVRRLREILHSVSWSDWHTP